MIKKTINIHLVEDSSIEVEGHLALYNYYEEINVVKISSNGLEAVRWEEKNSSDIMVVDLCMPIFDGIEVMKYLYRHKMDKKVIIYSGLITTKILKDLFFFGIKAYVVKNEMIENQLVLAIHEVHKGGTYFSDYVQGVLDDEKPEIKPTKKMDLSDKVLSKQESQVLDLMLNDNHNAMEEGALKQKTITDVMRRIRDKYNVANNVALVMKLLRR